VATSFHPHPRVALRPGRTGSPSLRRSSPPPPLFPAAGSSRYTEHIGVSSPYHLSDLPSARERSWLALVARVAAEGVAGGGEGTAGFNDRIARGVAEGSSGAEGRGCACAWSRASRSHSRSSTTVPHDPRSDPTTASVYRPHPHSRQPLSFPRVSIRKVASELRASSTGP